MTDYERRVEHLLDDMITEQGGDPHTEIIDDVTYSGGTLSVTTDKYRTKAWARAAAAAISKLDPFDGCAFASATHREYRASAFADDDGGVTVDLENRESGDERVVELSANAASIAAAAAELRYDE